MDNQQSDKTGNGDHKLILTKAIAALSIIALISLLIFLKLPEDRHNSSMQEYQNMETAARQIQITIEAYYSEHDRYPADKQVFANTARPETAGWLHLLAGANFGKILGQCRGP